MVSLVCLVKSAAAALVVSVGWTWSALATVVAVPTEAVPLDLILLVEVSKFLLNAVPSSLATIVPPVEVVSTLLAALPTLPSLVILPWVWVLLALLFHVVLSSAVIWAVLSLKCLVIGVILKSLFK